jgi:hypothetical protein
MFFDKELNMYFRSLYEANVARLLIKYNITYLYEPYFVVYGHKKYVPDFYLPEKGLFLEVKGLWRRGTKRKLRKWKKRINLILVPYYLEKSIKFEIMRRK